MTRNSLREIRGASRSTTYFDRHTRGERRDKRFARRKEIITPAPALSCEQRRSCVGKRVLPFLFNPIRCRDSTGGCCCPGRGSRPSQRRYSRSWCWLPVTDHPGGSGLGITTRMPVSAKRSFPGQPLTFAISVNGL